MSDRTATAENSGSALFDPEEARIKQLEAEILGQKWAFQMLLQNLLKQNMISKDDADDFIETVKIDCAKNAGTSLGQQSKAAYEAMLSRFRIYPE